MKRLSIRSLFSCGLPLMLAALFLTAWMGLLPADVEAAPAMPNNGVAQMLPFFQNWSNTGLITANDDWTGVPGVVGYRGDGLTASDGVNPQTVLADGTTTPVDVNANQSNPNTNITGGVAEFHLADPVVALQGSSTADAPFLLINLNTTGYKRIRVAYQLRDVDGSADNAIQPVALHYRVGNSGSFTNLPEGFIADATSGPDLATQVTPVSVRLPSAADNQPLVQVRVMTTNAAGNDEWVGVDDLQISGDSIYEIELAKVAPMKVASYETFTYTLIITNSTGVALSQAVLTDTLPAKVIFAGASDGGVLVGNVVSWTLPALAPNAAITRTLAVIAPASGVITNSVYGVRSDGWPTPTLGAAVVTRVIPVELGISQSVEAYGVAGETLTYAIQLAAQGALSATQVILTDTLPVGVTYLADTSGVTPITNTGRLIWSLPDLLPNTTWGYSVTVLVNPTLPGGTHLQNHVAVRTGVAGEDPSNNTAVADTDVYPLVPLYDVQHVPNPAASDASPYVGQVVWVEGVVVAEPGEIGTGVNNFVIADPAGGAWRGLMAYQGNTFAHLNIPEGAFVRLLGKIEEYQGMTEINIRTTPHALRIIRTASPLPAAAALQSSQFISTTQAEAWESVLIEFADATIVSVDPVNGEWLFENDGQPATADDFGRDDGDLTYQPIPRQHLTFVRGIGWYAFGKYQIQPRRDDDIALFYAAPVLSKSAPFYVAPGALFTYTITLDNYVSKALTQVVISDVLPSNATLAAVLDGGSLQGNTLTWRIASLPDQGQARVRFSVYATTTLGTPIWNQHYGMAAANWLTPTLGKPLLTVVGDTTPIPLIQGAGAASRLDGKTVAAKGVVVGFFQGNYSAGGVFDGFFLQDPVGDGDPATSDGIFVNTFADVPLGQWVVVTGTVQEFDEYDGAACLQDCLTQIKLPPSGGVQVLGSAPAITPTILQPLGAPIAGAAYFESLEGMLVSLPQTATVVGPTSFGAVTVVPGSEGVSRVLRHSPQEGMPLGLRHWLRYGGSFPPDLITGSVVEPFRGPLTWSFGGYMAVTQPGEFWTPVYTQPLPMSAPSWPAPGAQQFSVATFNTYNFDSTGKKLDKVVLAVQQMNGPTILALEEISPTAVMADLIGDLAAAGYPYSYAYSYASHGISVALLWRSDVITQSAWTTLQSCSPDGSTSANYDPLWAACRAQGMYPTFPRRPVVLTATLTLSDTTRQIVVIANHLKSKLDGEPSDRMRLAEAQFLADRVDAWVAQGQEYVIVLGDMNDYEDSPPLETLYASGSLTNTWYTLPLSERYSYIYHGVSQVLDHILVTPALWQQLVRFSPLHFSADYPYAAYVNDGKLVWRVADHDPLAAAFTLAPPVYRVYLPLVVR
jgi:uncharacterized repeat protein (TIGR01451 family)